MQQQHVVAGGVPANAIVVPVNTVYYAGPQVPAYQAPEKQTESSGYHPLGSY